MLLAFIFVKSAGMGTARNNRHRRAASRYVPRLANSNRGSSIFTDKKGTAAIEFGIVASFLCLLFLGLIDFGIGYWAKIQIGNAAREGGAYAIANGWDQTGIQNTVARTTSWGSISATPAPVQSCGCPNATTGIIAATCGSGCGAGGTAGTYVTVTAQATYASIVTYPGLANPLTLTASTIVRIN